MYRFLIPLTAYASTPQPTSWDSFEWDEDGVKLEKFIGDETEVVIPYGVRSIRDSAFEGCTFLTSVVIPESVKYLGDNTF